MGNKLTRRRPAVDERFTRPQGLYLHRDLDQRKLRRSILNGQLAPCFLGVEDAGVELDECPICFLFYPSLNRSKCCTKGLCTECYLQIKASHAARSAQCPFCKTPNYSVEYRGAKTVEEKGVEQAEEQKVIEAKIRIRRKELLDEEQRMLRREEDLREGRPPAPSELIRRNFSNLHGFTLPSESVEATAAGVQIGVQGQSEAGVLSSGHPPDADPGPASQIEAVTQCHTARMQGLISRSQREDDFDIDLEDIMLMEAIWLSIQEQGHAHQVASAAATPGIAMTLEHSGGVTNQNHFGNNDDSRVNLVQDLTETRGTAGRNSMTGGLAGAIAALAERQVESRLGQLANNASSEINTPIGGEERSEMVVEGSNRTSTSGVELLINDSAGASTSMNSGSHVSPCVNSTLSDIDLLGEKPQVEEVISQEQRGQELNSWIDVSLDSGRALSPLTRGESRLSICDSMLDQSSEAVEVGTSFSSSVPSTSELPWEAPDVTPQGAECPAEPCVVTSPAPMLPESFEEQMMLAMALSLAEAQAQAQRF